MIMTAVEDEAVVRSVAGRTEPSRIPIGLIERRETDVLKTALATILDLFVFGLTIGNSLGSKGNYLSSTAK